MNIISWAKGAFAVAKGFAVANAPVILIGAAAVGVISVAVTAWKCGKASQKAVEKATVEKGDILTKKEEFSVKGKYIAAVVASVILCIGSMGAGFYLEHKALCEMTATANTLLANNKELNAEITELSNITPEQIKQVKADRAWEQAKKCDIKVEYGDLIYDEFLQRTFRMPIEVAQAAKHNFIEYYHENSEASIKDLYDFLHQDLHAIAGTKLGWLETNHSDFDEPFISFEEETRERENGDIESMWIMRYFPMKLDSPSYFSGLSDYRYRDDYVNDNELEEGIGRAFA